MGADAYTLYWKKEIDVNKVIDIIRRLHQNEETELLAAWLGYVSFDEKQAKQLRKNGYKVKAGIKYLQLEQYDQPYISINHIFGFDDYDDDNEPIYGLEYTEEEKALLSNLDCFYLYDELEDGDELFDLMEKIDIESNEEKIRKAKEILPELKEQLEYFKTAGFVECIRLEQENDKIEEFVIQVGRTEFSKRKLFFVVSSDDKIIRAYTPSGDYDDFKKEAHTVFDEKILLSYIIDYLESEIATYKELLKDGE